ncbi:MAG: hypothetical protein AB4042_17715 [Leptolyngbyaceae cyanobacterium]
MSKPTIDTTAIAVDAELTLDSGDNPVSPANKTDHPVDRCQAIAFTIAHYWFAIPVPAILKVIRLDPTMTSDIEQSGFIMLEGRPLAVVDLRLTLPSLQQTRLFTPDAQTHLPQFAQSSTSPIPEEAGVPCLMAIRPTQEELWALRVDQPPALLELPLSYVHPIVSTAPRSVRAIAQHMAVLPPKTSGPWVRHPIFLMNLAAVYPGGQGR